MEAYVRQKRTQNGMVLASDVPPMALMRPSTATGAQHVQSPQSPHAYDGPLQFTMSPHNPDQMRSQSPAGHDGKDIHMAICSYFWNCFCYVIYDSVLDFVVFVLTQFWTHGLFVLAYAMYNALHLWFVLFWWSGCIECLYWGLDGKNDVRIVHSTLQLLCVHNYNSPFVYTM